MTAGARILGAVLAGGQSRRFGSDKALAPYRGMTLLDHAVTLAGQLSETVVVCGGERAGYDCVPDIPQPGLGPLGGLCGAFTFAARQGCNAVLSLPCDTPGLTPETLRALIGDGPACLAELPVAGYWPTALLAPLTAHLAGDANRSMRGWAQTCGARLVASPPIANINRVGDLRSLE